MRLRPVHERDELIREHVETNHYFDEASGELWDPADVDLPERPITRR